ncbi:hypothetical protein KP509_12G064300 [Ceratopteris richardii]|uniref:Uncharacterized protein n=1 Tax=Ceratopteris richardii TaxID=49495 RepID=A0A8T2TPB2_CERRI|nr:hypothetical protein KP509_12G064300 [Ceratopteris richardii]
MGSLGKALYHVGFWIRETGQALDRLGSRLQGINAFQEKISRHRTLMNLCDRAPDASKSVFVAPSAALIGDVKVGGGSSIWYGCVLRGDVSSITVGSRTNIQDNSLIHVSKPDMVLSARPTVIGNGVTIGHSAVLHGCTVEDNAFIGMGATLLDGVHVEKNAMVAAGAVVKQNTKISTGEVWAGNPAKMLRKLTDEEIAFFPKSAEHYSKLAETHAEENSRSYDEVQAGKTLWKKWYLESSEFDAHAGVIQEKPPVEVTLQDSTIV